MHAATETATEAVMQHTATRRLCRTPEPARSAQAWFRTILVLVGTAFLVQGVLFGSAAVAAARLQTRQLRLTPLALRNESIAGPTDPPAISGLGALSRGCVIFPTTTAAAGGGALTVSFAESVAIDGFWFVTGPGPTGRDPIKYRIDLCSMDTLNCSGWTEWVMPPWVGDERLQLVPLARGVMKRVDLRPPAARLVASSVGVPALTAGCFCAAMFGAAGRGRAAVLAVAAGFAFLAATQLGWAVSNTIAMVAVDANGPDADAEDGPVWVDKDTTWTAWSFVLTNSLTTWAVARELYVLDALLILFTASGSIGLIEVMGGDISSRQVLFGCK